MSENEDIKKEPENITYAEEFLSCYKLPKEYAEHFIENGYESPEMFFNVTEKDLNEWKFKKGHIIFIMKKIKEIQSEKEKNIVKKMQEIKICSKVENINIDVIVIGFGSTGKSTLLERFRNHKIPEKAMKLTEGKVDIKHHILKRNKSITLNFRDIGGQDEFFDRMTGKEFANASVAIAVCSIDTYPNSILALEHKYLPTLREANSNCKIFFVCNKMDLWLKHKDIDKKIIEDFNRINNNNGNMFKPIYFVSAVENTNITKVLDDIILEDCVSDYICNKNIEINNKQIKKRCDELVQSIRGKMIAFWVEDNDFYGVSCIKEHKRKWKEEEYENNKIYYCNFDGNEWNTSKFAIKCQEIFQSIEYADKEEVVDKMYEILRNEKWHPTVFAFNMNKQSHIVKKCNEEWNMTTDKIMIIAFC